MFLSIIIPCLNVGRYIDRCLDSIFQSEVPEDIFEVICVYDQSKDDTLLRLKSYANRHDNMQIIISEQNRGCGGARTAGLMRACGSYVWNIDADDKIVPSFFSNLRIEGENIDVLCFNYRDVFLTGVREYPVFADVSHPLDGKTFIKSVFKNRLSDHIGYVWRFIYRRQYLLDNGLYFQDNVSWEDTLYMPKSLVLAKNVISTSLIGYEYFHNDSSVCGTFGRRYPGRLVYELVFCAGEDLLHLSEQVDDMEIAEQLKNCAINDYFNQLPIYLCRQNRDERKVFYSFVNNSRLKVKHIVTYMRPLPKAMLFPFAGPFISLLVSTIYKLTHR